MKFDTLTKLAKIATSIVVASGTKKIVSGVIENNVTIGRPKDKIAVAAATWVISGIIATAAKEYSDKTIDDGIKNIRQGVEWVKTTQALSRINKGESTFEKEGLDEAKFERKDGTWVPRPEEPATAVN